MTRSTSPTLMKLALVVTTGVTLTAVMSPAGHAADAPTTAPTTFAGTSQAMGLHLEINIPGAVSINQDISLATAALSKTTSSTGTATAEAFHSGTGSLLAPVFDALNQTATADPSTRQSSKPVSPNIADPASLATIAGGTVTATYVPETAAGFGSTGVSQVAAIGVGLATPQLTTALNSAIAALNAAVTQVSTTATTSLGMVTGPVAGLIPTTGTPVDQLQQTVADLPAQLATAVTQLQAGLAGITNVGGALTLQGVTTTSSVTRTTDAVTSTAGANILGIDLLGGLVHVAGTQSLVSATATGAAGSATTTMQSPQIAAVTVGSLAALQATVTDLTAEVGAVTLPEDVTSQLNTVISSINGFLALANVRVADLGHSSSTAADGTSATSSVSGLGITVGSPAALAALGTGADASTAAAGDTTPLIAIELSPASASATAQRVEAPVVVPPAAVTPTVTKLAYTGFNGDLSVGVALTLVIGAGYLVRRRRLSA